jgi:hypothetical protein
MSLTVIPNILIRFQILGNAVYDIFTAMIILWAITGRRHFNMWRGHYFMIFKERTTSVDFILLSNKKHEIYNISKLLPVMTGSNADARNYAMSKENREVYNPWKFHWIIFSRFGDHSQTKLVFQKQKMPISPDRK